jgi:hypothetical protein
MSPFVCLLHVSFFRMPKPHNGLECLPPPLHNHNQPMTLHCSREISVLALQYVILFVLALNLGDLSFEDSKLVYVFESCHF